MRAEVVCFLIFACISICHGNPLLLFTTSRDIRVANISRPQKVSTIVKDLENGAALDFYYEGRLVCWTDSRLGTIQCITYNNTHVGPKTVLVNGGLIMPDGLACDWLTKKLYWTDGETNRIEVISLDKKHRKVLFWEELDQPRAITLVPMESIMFWTDWGETSKIERAAMDGDPSSRRVIVSEKIFWPNGITADYDAKKIYWVDGKLNFIEVMDYDGRNRRRILDGIPGERLQYPYSLTFFKDRIYWTDWKTWSVHMLNRTSNSTREVVHSPGAFPVDVRVMDPSRQPSKVTPCSDNNGGCSHLCLLSPFPPGYSCACPTGVRLNDTHTCADGPQEMILLVQIHDISLISLDSPDHTSVSLDLRGIKHAVGIDYDPLNGYVYWSDFEAKIIRRALLNGTKQEDVISSELQFPDGLAIDWRAQNLYWTDSGTDRIQVLRIDTPFTKDLVNTDLVEPRAIVVSPDEGLMFWADWNDERPKIERAHLDGSSRTLLVSDHLGWPNGLALDISNRRLYWCDANTDKIEVIDYDGTDRKEVITQGLPHPFGLTLSGDRLYWTDWQKRSLDSGNKITGSDRKVIVDHIANIMGLKAVGPMPKPNGGNNPCSSNNGNCAHLCFNTPSKYICACQIGYELEANGRSCVVPEAFLLYAKKENIGRISIENAHNDAIIPASGIKDASALDFDIREGRIYWTDVKAKVISRAFVNGSHVEKLVEFGLESPEGLAVDWNSRNIYWTDTNARRIEVARVDGRYRRPVIWKDLQEPRSIAIDPLQNYMYWSDWGGPGSLHRARLDGSSREMLLSKLGRANSLTLDLIEGRVYWCAIQGQVEASSLDGSKRAVIVQSPTPFSMSLYRDKIYWTDWKTGELFVANKHTGDNRTLLHSNLQQVTSVVVYHGWGRTGRNQCFGSGGGHCHHLCLGGVCACQAHYSLHNDKCIPPSSYLIYSTKNSINRLIFEDGECPDSPMPVHGLKNVIATDFDPVRNTLFWLDGRSQSIRKWSASGGSSVVVSGGHHPSAFAVDYYYGVLFWSCAQDGTINATRLDNESTSPSTVVVVRTHEWEKPKYLAVHPMKSVLFWTTEGRDYKIYRSQLDGLRRTVLVTLASPILSLTVDKTHKNLYWATSQAIEFSNFDGKNRAIVATGDKFSSLAILGKSLYWLHGKSLMTANLDGGRTFVKWTAPTPLTSLAAVAVPNKKFQAPYWQCVTGERFPSHMDCSRDRPCSPDQFSCLSSPGDCVPMSFRCDSAADCLDGSDEMNCPQCGPSQFPCQPSLCIDRKYLCDGTPHCPDNSDETTCCEASGGFQCSGGSPGSQTMCLSRDLRCDGWAHCPDKSDEDFEMCAELANSKGPQPTPQDSHPYMLIVAFIAAGIVIAVSFIIYRWRKGRSKCDGVSVVQPGDPALDPLSPRGRRSGTGTSSSTPGGNGYLHNHHHQYLGHYQGGSTSTGFVMSTIMQQQHSSSCSQPSSSSLPPFYPLNPPPSPATTAKEEAIAAMQGFRGFYHPPPPTPCSTDVCHETDSNYQGESEPLPPPPTPTSASPSPSSSTYFHPTPPPPSPTG